MKSKTITLWERRGFWNTIHIHDQKKEWDRQEFALLLVLKLLAEKKRLPENWVSINKAMAESHNYISIAFKGPGQERAARVVDIEDLLYQLL